MIYLVYEQWRPDTNVCFYVGKGKLRRAKDFTDWPYAPGTYGGIDE